MRKENLLRHWWLWLLLLLAVAGGTATYIATTHQAAPKRTTTKTVAKAIDWQQPSEKKAYPNAKQTTKFNILVSTAKHRVFLRSKDKVLYTMYASTGKDNSTPKGTFEIQTERGQFFYNSKSGEGAHYWTSFKDHGIYLFHTVPTNRKGHYLKDEAKALGHSANSHGCVRLSVPDAKYIFEQVPTGTPVTVI
ncbi:L,D-transpeptidase [Lacticaseibacillus saniviri]